MIIKRKSKIGRKYNLLKDTHDPRDYRWTLPPHLRDVPLPSSVDLRPTMPPVYDQGPYGTCYANAVAGAVHFLQNKRVTPSRLYIAWNACVCEGETVIAEENGIVSLRDTISPLTDKGYVPEASWPYDRDHLNVIPFTSCFADGATHLVTSYERLLVLSNDLQSIKTALAEGRPVIFGMQVYKQFESASCAATGIVETPGWWDRQFNCLGGHAVLAVGYDDATQMFTVRNSWSSGWGRAGYFFLPYDYMSNSGLTNDFWVLNGLVDK